MQEKFNNKNVTLEQMRLLTEVGNLLQNRQLDGSYPQEVLEGILDNLVTKVQEDAMSSAVSLSFQPVGEYQTATGETRRSFVWRGLGKTAVQVAESGFEYHWSQEAHQRVKIEVEESKRSEVELNPGVWHTFISPRMSTKDADKKIAEDEHLANEDAIRCSYAVSNDAGEVTGRQMVSILVRDVPLSAWVDMLRDPNNIFGHAFEIKDESSALSVMELFSQLDLPIDRLPEGPVSLVEAVNNYVKNIEDKDSIAVQISDFRQDQEKLRIEAMYTANKWREFEKDLASSVGDRVMHKNIKIFTVQLQNEWPEDVLRLLNDHETADGGCAMSVELAAVLEKAWQKINLAKSAVVVKDKRSLKNISSMDVEHLREQILFIRVLDQGGAMNAAQYSAVNSQLNRRIAHEKISTGGGCGPKNEFRFGNKRNPKNSGDVNYDIELGELEYAGSDNGNDQEENEEGIGNVHYSRCRTGYCPSDDKIVKVGGCSVCLRHCQPEYDKGNDPAEVFANRTNTRTRASRELQASFLLELFSKKTVEKQNKMFAAA